MERDEAARLLTECRGAYELAKRTRQDAWNQMQGTEQIIKGILVMFPDLADNGHDAQPGAAATEDERPRGAEAARSVLVETPGKWFSVDMIVHELGRRGWLPDSPTPANAVRTALERLIATEPTQFWKDRGTKTQKVVYVYKPEGSEEVSPL